MPKMTLKARLRGTQDRLTMQLCTIPSAVVTQALAAAECRGQLHRRQGGVPGLRSKPPPPRQGRGGAGGLARRGRTKRTGGFPHAVGRGGGKAPWRFPPPL